MQDFILNAASSLGVSEETSSGATSALLGQISEAAGPKILNLIGAQVPGLNALVPEKESGGGGLFGKVAAFAGGGGGIAGALTGAGLDMDQVSPFAKMFFDYLKSNGAGPMVGNLGKLVPGVEEFLG